MKHFKKEKKKEANGSQVQKHMPIIPSIPRLRQKDFKFKASPWYEFELKGGKFKDLKGKMLRKG